MDTQVLTVWTSATLLLTHARTQKVNQQRLENYLASSTTPNLDVSSRLQSPHRPRNRNLSPVKGSGTDTPRDLNARVKILELYTLHVLLRNNEWDYAREFITISSVLDEERREAFLQALESLQEELKESERLEKEQQQYQEEQLKRDMEEARRRRIENEERERKREEEERLKRDKARAGSEIDYGVEDTPARPGSSRSKSSAKAASIKGSSHKKSASDSSPTARSAAPAKKVPPTLMTRAGNIISNIMRLVEEMTKNFKTKPMFLLQFLAFIIGLLAILSRRDVKERIKRIMGGAWGKVRQTAGMGVKVSYI